MSDRFFQKVRRDDDGCHRWIGCLVWGYGRLKRGGKMYRAHRVAWELANGPIPAGLFVLHRCDTRSCVNPEHLFLGTQRENVRDMRAKGRHPRMGKEDRDLTNATRFEIQLSSERHRQLTELASEAGLSAAGLARLAIGQMLEQRVVRLPHSHEAA